MQEENCDIQPLPISVIITTKDEEKRLPACLKSLDGSFAQVHVVDSYSTDKTCQIAQEYGAQLTLFEWNGRYPKKRQWCLENLDIQYDWVFWLDADERLTPDFINVLRQKITQDVQVLGFFVKASYLWNGRLLKYGMQNAKLQLFRKEAFFFPEVDDLSYEGMGEIEGHYQPISRRKRVAGDVLCLPEMIIHDAYSDYQRWENRHDGYAQWEAQMIRSDRYPHDPIFLREVLKRTTRRSPMRPLLIFLYCFILKKGFLDGRAGYSFAKSRYDYTLLVRKYLRAQCRAST